MRMGRSSSRPSLSDVVKTVVPATVAAVVLFEAIYGEWADHAAGANIGGLHLSNYPSVALNMGAVVAVVLIGAYAMTVIQE